MSDKVAKINQPLSQKPLDKQRVSAHNLTVSRSHGLTVSRSHGLTVSRSHGLSLTFYNAAARGTILSIPHNFRYFVFLAALISDMAAKYFAQVYLTPVSAGQQPVFPSLLLYHNYGITFSLFENYQALNLMTPLIGIAALLFLCVKSGTIRRMSGIAFLFAGAAGNLTCRLTYGYVVDWIYVGVYINLADIWLCVGNLLIFIQCFKNRGRFL